MSPSNSHLYEAPTHPSDVRPSPRRSVLVLDRDAVRSVDRAAIEEFGIPGIVLMENAARALLDEAMKMLRPNNPASALRVLIVCGSGNNGGDGYALARHLHNRRIQVTLTALGEPKSESDAAMNRAICRRMSLHQIDISQIRNADDVHGFALIVDAIFGTGLDRLVTGQAADVIAWINASNRPVLAADVPSGIDCNTGGVLGCAVRATKTVTFVGLKTGFLEVAAQKLLGEVVVADIGAPVELLTRFGKVIDGDRHDSPDRVVDRTPARTRPGR